LGNPQAATGLAAGHHLEEAVVRNAAIRDDVEMKLEPLVN
jgi:hypothetical protein